VKGEKNMRHLLIVVLICAITTPWANPKETSLIDGHTDGWRFVATVSSLDSITHTHVRSLLKSHGIECTIEGSVDYGVSVPGKDYTQAVTILKQDLKIHRYNITIHAGGKDIKHAIPGKMWRDSAPKMNYQELIGLALYKPATDIGALLRSDEVCKEITTFPHVVRIKSLERKYLNSSGKTNIGHEFEIELAVKSGEQIGGKRLRFQVWDNGRQIRSLGSNEWRQGGKEEKRGQAESAD
jgi:hypothetical protein